METVISREELRKMQAWPLQRKIAESKKLVQEWYEAHNGKVYVSFSAGKDSTVLLHLVRKVYPDVPAVYVDTGCEYPENVAFSKTLSNVVRLRYNMAFNDVLHKFGYPVISKDVSKRIYYARKGSSWAINQLNGLNSDGTYSKFNMRYKKWRVLMDAPFPIAEKCCNELKSKPLNRYQRESGRASIIGTMASESQRRETTLLRYGINIYRKYNPTSKPMSFWLEEDVLRYLNENKLPYSKIYGDITCENGKWRTTGVKRTGCMFCLCGAHLEKQPNRFQQMALTHPEQYNTCINILDYGKVMGYLEIPYQPLAENTNKRPERSNAIGQS